MKKNKEEGEERRGPRPHWIIYNEKRDTIWKTSYLTAEAARAEYEFQKFSEPEWSIRVKGVPQMQEGIPATDTRVQAMGDEVRKLLGRMQVKKEPETEKVENVEDEGEIPF